MTQYYFDHAATTPMRQEVAAAMLAVMTGGPGNPSSMHRYGRSARGHMNRARDTIASFIGAKPTELLFTSGGTESDNLAIIGGARAMKAKGKNHIITSAAEHHAVLHTCQSLESEGFELTVLPVDSSGQLSVDVVRDAMTDRTGLVSVMYANNEVGTVQPIVEIGELVQQHGALVHVDAVQALGSIPIHVQSMPVDLMSFSAHKINGPQGVGALYIASGSSVIPIVHGGSQERKRRAGTENVAGVVGFAAAVEAAAKEMSSHADRMEQLRQHWISLMNTVTDSRIVLNGHKTERLAHIVNLSFLDIDTETMLMNLDMAGIAASGGSACTSGSLERSHVLMAMGVEQERLMTAVRFSFGMGNTLEELSEAAQLIETIVRRVRK
ncbi:cysteine desulfurase [Paenibacillus cellulosilyticus]|uniref:cysteine desulfurase n=1 Tax=Paenibacillus cellulosilyticus TaxID=375489 RepID=A0A2V2YAQ2_9BACL|nr:cysteine desulfurase family protein [Paenibacillus cellulosilyticus]PWV88415.1 cysteine desulfurase [Paenibacillus cellulosilyticus]QKS43382.1 cysteine desulfurase [Paenibacillus cellulosilyticus]